MSIIQNITAQCIGGKLALKWETMGDCVAISIQTATDSEFTKNERCYVIPKINAVDLDSGGGFWYVRIGAWIGDTTSGIIKWSGVYGPVAVVNPKSLPPLKPSPAFILHTQAIQTGMRFHTENIKPMFFVIEVSSENTFRSTATKTQYVFDYGKKHVDCLHLLFGKVYSIRFGAFTTEALNKMEIRQLGEWQTIHNMEPARPIKPVDNTQAVAEKGDAVYLREVSQRKIARFTSHSDYLRFKAAETRTREGKT